jgi:hypothetical protein
MHLLPRSIANWLSLVVLAVIVRGAEFGVNLDFLFAYTDGNLKPPT